MTTPAAWVEALEQQALQPLGDRQHLFDSRIGLGGFLEFWLVGDRLFEGHGLGWVLRHELRELVDLAERHFEHSPDIAHHAARQKRAESDDLSDAILAVALAHISDHFVAPILAKVDVEVWHRYAFGIEKALEQQAETQRVEVGDRQRPRHQRSGARAAPGPHRNALGLRPFDEVGDDEEIAGELHLDDDRELELEALDVVRGGKTRRASVALQMALEALVGLALELLDLVDHLAPGNGKARQDRLARQRAIGERSATSTLLSVASGRSKNSSASRCAS